MLRRIGSGDGAASLAALVRGLGKADKAELQLTFLTAIRAALRGQRRVEPPADWASVYARIAKSDSEPVRLQAAALGVTFGDEAAMVSFRGLVASKSAATDARREALAALLDANDPGLAPTLQALVADPAMRDVALRGLAQYDDAKTPAVLLAAYPSLTPDEKRGALATLCSRAGFALALLEAIEQKKLAGADLTADLIRQLQYLKNDQITSRLREVWGEVRQTPAEKVALIAQYKQLIESSSGHPGPDPELGRAIFAKTCQRCHVLYGVGAKLGPDLTGSNRADVDYLLGNIVDPSAVMANEYRQTLITMDDGQVIAGLLRGEDGKAVTIQTADATVIAPKNEIIDRVTTPLSMMPEDQLKPFSDHEVRSLIAYLRGKQQTPMLATPDNAMLFNGKDLTGWSGNAKLWSVENGQIVGQSAGLSRNEFLISDLSAANFKLSLEVKLVANAGNSGIQFRSEAMEKGEVKGYQADIGAGWWGKLYEEHGRALLWDKSGEQHVKHGQWNTYQIVANGSRLRTYINGELCVDLDDPKGARRGVFAFQLHSGGPTEVRIRNVKLEVTE
jgi:putative heme-binding domain-containing protein